MHFPEYLGVWGRPKRCIRTLIYCSSSFICLLFFMFCVLTVFRLYCVECACDHVGVPCAHPMDMLVGICSILVWGWQASVTLTIGAAV